MRILIVGSGGREHALIWALNHTAKSPVQLFCAPGNAGIQQLARVFPVSVMDQSGLVDLARSEDIDLTFIGPEAPLAAGLVDRFEAEGLAVIGPSESAARLEASKVFAKDFMSRYSVPTARYRVAHSPSEAVKIIDAGELGSRDCQVVIKADGLAAGKGVIIADSQVEARKAVEDLMVRHVAGNEAAERVVIEEALSGQEISLLVFTDGHSYATMPVARDHKRIGENDTGPNTGGMGTITDPSLLDKNARQQILEQIVEPTLAGARHEGFPFRGVLFLGLMLTESGPQLLEYNVRFGDPETQAILIRLKSDLVDVLEAIQHERLGSLKLEWTEGSSACVVLASEGYPGKYVTGSVIEGLSDIDDDALQVFHAGTTLSEDGRFLTNGGRVLGVTAAAPGLKEALNKCYLAVGQIHWPGMQFRRDIGSSCLG